MDRPGARDPKPGISLNQLTEGLDADVRADGPIAPVSGACEDARNAQPGWIFIARKGQTHDGRDFAPQAIASGAHVIVTDDPSFDPKGAQAVIVHPRLTEIAPTLAARAFDHPSRSLAVIAITGSNGKTTVAHFARDLLQHASIPTGLIGTVEVHDGERATQASLTTPHACDLHAALARMRDNGCKAVAIEASSIGLARNRYADIDTDAAVFTNLSHDHLDDHGDMTAYAQAKSLLFKSLPSSATAIANADNLWMLSVCGPTRARILKCTMKGRLADASVLVFPDIDDDRRSRVVLTGPWGAVQSRLAIPGAHNAMNLLQAFTAAWSIGADAGRLACAIESLALPRGRMHEVDARSQNTPRVFVDFAHTPDALEKAILAAREIADESRVICVFGCGGDRDRTKRPTMGAIAATLADAVVITSDNPRREQPDAIIHDILAGIPHKHDPQRRADVEIEPDRERAIHRAISLATHGDVVLIAGKGHERSQILPDGAGATKRIEFDDARVATAALQSRAVTVETRPMTPRLAPTPPNQGDEH